MADIGKTKSLEQLEAEIQSLKERLEKVETYILDTSSITSYSTNPIGAYETDDLFEQAVKVVVQFERASPSLLQRRLSIGYARAARLIDLLEAKGVVGPAEGAKPRKVLLRDAKDSLTHLEEVE